MELVGEEKRIQALFSELRLADEQTVPRFATVWNRAQAQTVRPARVFNFSFVAATALLVCALVSLAWWSQQWDRGQQTNVVATPKPAEAPGQKIPALGTKPISSNETSETRPAPKRNVRAMKLAAMRRAHLLAAIRKTTRDAQAISSWQSPTSTLLKSQNDELLKSLPQLNENADELRSFLPNAPK